MPLHLLGKKSWNVYNIDNIEKVKRDEAAAKAREEEDERRMQEIDAQGRLETLRGIQPAATSLSDQETKTPIPLDRDRQFKKRRIGGEDDTDRDIRLAKAVNSLDSIPLAVGKRESSKASSNAPITNAQGHISLFPEEPTSRRSNKNAENEAEKSKKKQEYEDQYTMRFSNAAGFKQKLETPWYSSIDPANTVQDVNGEVGKDVWGNEDRGRLSREKARLDANDPLAFMKKGVKQLRSVELERQKWQTERAKEMGLLEKLDRPSSRALRLFPDDLESFSLEPAVRSRRDKSSSHHTTESKKVKKRRHSNSNSEHNDRVERQKYRHRHDSHHHPSSRSRTAAKDSNPEVSHKTFSLEGAADPSERHRRRHKSSGSAKSKEDDSGWKPGIGGRYSSQFAAAD